MTLIEYLNQTTPQKNQKVFLTPTEYVITNSVKAGNNHFKRIYITASQLLSGIEYVQVNDEKNLYTTDSDGNPKNLSCFYLN